MRAFAKGIAHDVGGAGEGFVLPDGVRGGMTDLPTLSGAPLPGRLHRLAKAMLGYDLVLTYGYDAINAVMAHTAFSQAYPLPRLIHHEGEGPEAERRTRRADWYRRIALGRAAGLVVPHEELERRALEDWQQPLGRVKHIGSAVDPSAFARTPPRDGLPRLIKRRGEKWVGTTGPLEEAMRLPLVLRIVSELPENWHLVVWGQGEAAGTLAREAESFGMQHRLHLLSRPVPPASVMGLFDIVASAALDRTEPAAPLAAMAAGVPIAAIGASRLPENYPEKAREFVSGDSESDLEEAVGTLASDAPLREEVGEALRRHARTAFDEAAMIAKFRLLYSSAMGRPDLP
jgi:glycosyltransferase involved in cell wall biosynthesis